MTRPVKTVALSRGYQIHDQIVREVRLKEPTAEDYLDLGEPFEMQRTVDGATVIIENRPAVKGYIDACIDGVGPENIALLSLDDGRRLREAMLDFFRRPEPSATPSTGSSSGSDGAPPTSAG